jgi:hypothetical protein
MIASWISGLAAVDDKHAPSLKVLGCELEAGRKLTCCLDTVTVCRDSRCGSAPCGTTNGSIWWSLSSDIVVRIDLRRCICNLWFVDISFLI